MIVVHGTCVDVAGVGVLLLGPPGSGKSDLALRLIDAGARLIADDRVELAARDDALFASVPASIAGIIEVRGLGIVPVPWQPGGRLGLVVDLVAEAEIERMPEPAVWECEGVSVTRYAMAPFEASACAKVRWAVRAARTGGVASR